ncbi:DUF6624 domain-containing protein [Pseudoduganella lutea]|uniref:Uncharacterized protein n=1 Tax=Pseudoduganella lutea TaxID=321985 RepID=A0A4P6KZC0_9BURK|nr:DUF6624 domain-containing protein [Pseudoduganella lutea]QBE64145.1 hypothetical protein EWM63_15110 [Pseudoduganella lutea]
MRLLLPLVLLSTTANAADVALPALRADLLRWQEIDQAVLKGDASPGMVAVVQRRHTAELKSVFARHGWPTIAMVGKDASQAAWLLVQHADEDRAWQRTVLRAMEPLVAANEVVPQSFAYLSDRVAVGAGEAQLYGTQGRCVARLRWEPHPLRVPEEVDARRAGMQLPPLADYRAMASERICAGFGEPGLE